MLIYQDDSCLVFHGEGKSKLIVIPSRHKIIASRHKRLQN